MKIQRTRICFCAPVTTSLNLGVYPECILIEDTIQQWNAYQSDSFRTNKLSILRGIIDTLSE